MSRLAFRAILALAGVGGIAWFGFHALLGTDYATAKVAARLQSLFGVPVTIQKLDVSLDGSAAVGVSVFETDRGSPFLTIGRAETDLGLTDLVGGDTHPNKLILTDAHLILRHDRAGHCLTRIPQSTNAGELIPEIRLKNSRVTIQREGEPDCVFQGIDVTARVQNRTLTLEGGANDDHWGGAWRAAAVLSLDGGAIGHVQMQSAGLHVRQATLEQLPYISKNVWTHVNLDGHTPVDVRLTLGKPGEKTRYRVTLSPNKTNVFVPTIDLRASDASGHVVIEDEIVTLQNVRGTVADGELFLKQAVLDFRPTNGSIQRYVIEAKRLNLRGLPATWKLPPRLGGRLSGQADLIVRVTNGVAVPSGTGEGRVDGALLGPIPIPNYGLRIQADANGLRFEPRLGY